MLKQVFNLPSFISTWGCLSISMSETGIHSKAAVSPLNLCRKLVLINLRSWFFMVLAMLLRVVGIVAIIAVVVLLVGYNTLPDKKLNA